MSVETRNARSAMVATAVALAFALPPAADAGGRSTALAADNATWRAECGSCHVPYPPALLPAAEWRALMRSLDRHFDSDASLDTTAAAEIERFLAANAGSAGGRAPQVQPRITTTRRFLRKHDEVSAAAFRSATVKSPANCAACHPAAATGNFDDHAVRIPR